MAMNATKECCLESPVSVNRQKLQEIWSKLERLFDNGAKQDLVEIGGVKPLTNSGETAKAEVVVEMLAKDQVEEFRATKVELEKRCIAKVEVEEPRAKNEVVVEECANKEVFVRSGDLDPGEVAAEVEEPRVTKDELGFCATKDTEFELLRFVTAGCRAQGTNSEYG